MNTTENLMNGAVTAMISSVVESTSKTGARFASLTYTTEAGKTARYHVLLGVKMENVYKADLRTLKALRSTLDGIKLVACDELIKSISESLEKGIGNNSAYTLKGYFSNVTPNGEVKLHKDDVTGQTFLYIRGYVVKETVMVPGVYAKVNSSPKTLAKKDIEKGLKRGNIRTFKINVAVLEQIKMNGTTLEIN